MSPSQTPPGSARGYIIAVGGAERKDQNPTILERFVEIAGGSQAEILVIPTASELEDTGPQYERLFEELGAGIVGSLQIDDRRDCDSPENLSMVDSATAIFITGGNQLRLSTILGGTLLATAIRRKNASGTAVGGTSAGAAIIPEHMIAGGLSGATPRPENVTLAPGLGLTNRIIIDQHFRERNRLGRLLTAISYNPFASGIGLDENTAIFIDPGGEFEVIGSGAVTVIDPTALEYSSMGVARRGEPVSLIGLRLHILTGGGRYHTETNATHPAVYSATNPVLE